MRTFLCITVRFLQPFSHGRGDGGQPEWPPSPLRLFQALVASSAGRWNERIRLTSAAPALNWLESQPCPVIVAADATPSTSPHRLYVPDNVADKVAASWCRDREASIADHRTEKDVRPMQLSGDAVHYLYLLAGGKCAHLETLTAAARSLTHLGWGVDMVTGDVSLLSDKQTASLDGHRWQPTAAAGGTRLRIPIEGSLLDLMNQHTSFLNRLSDNRFRPVPPLQVFEVRGYRRADAPQRRPYRVLELRRFDGSRSRYPQRKLVHIAGMVRHLAIKAMEESPPAGVARDWVESYVAGHAGRNTREHRQLSYLPLPSIGLQHTDPGIRRVMIAAPVGDDAWLAHLTRRLAGQPLRPENGDEFSDGRAPLLVPIQNDNISLYYTTPSNTWASVTPVILPGHDDRKPDKTRRLIEIALVQSGVKQPCTFEWSAFSRFPKSLSAHKYDRDKRPTGYIRPHHLLSQTAVHLRLRFDNELEVPGPIVIGAGRHCGFGLMARLKE